jgi:hypothetical protein
MKPKASADGCARYRLEVEPLDLGADVRAVGLDLVDVASGEPAGGADAARIWSAVLKALASGETWALDFFGHLERLREYCRNHGLHFREAASRSIVVTPPGADSLAALLERFAGETFGVRAGTALAAGDSDVEGDLSRRGVDAYHHAYGRYVYCGVCDFENGFLTLLTDRLSTSEVLRRIRPAVESLRVEATRPK